MSNHVKMFGLGQKFGVQEKIGFRWKVKIGFGWKFYVWAKILGLSENFRFAFCI